jgi:D-sedoheptulose 7-phosphate isomerase
MDGHDFAASYLGESLGAMEELARDGGFRDLIVAMAEAVTGALRQGGKLLIAGNGGSAADAQHIAGELVGRFLYDRAPLAAVALTADASVLTATGNDYGYEAIFERQVLGIGKPGDVFLGISTSGNSPNVVRALDTARGHGMVTLGFTGAGGGRMRALCDLLFAAPSPRTAVVQQLHITAAHILCALVERAIFPRATG